MTLHLGEQRRASTIENGDKALKMGKTGEGSDLNREDHVMYDIKDEDLLARVHKYEIIRKDGHLWIDVLEIVAGRSSKRFIAIPNRVIETAAHAYHGFGDSEAAALEDCLRKIRDVPVPVIVPIPTA